MNAMVTATMEVMNKRAPVVEDGDDNACGTTGTERRRPSSTALAVLFRRLGYGRHGGCDLDSNVSMAEVYNEIELTPAKNPHFSP